MSETRRQCWSAVFGIGGLLTVAACGGAGSPKAATSTTNAVVSERGEGDIRRLEALQTKNPGWTVQLDARGRTMATKRWASLMREDIRAELEPFVQRNASELGADASMKRVIDEPTHVRYESRATKQAIDARLRDGALVVSVERAD